MITEKDLLAAFIKESVGDASIANIETKLRFYPIKRKDELVGIVGFSENSHADRKVGIMQVLYILPEHRGRDLRKSISGFLHMLKNEGFTDVEAWAMPSMATWVERVFGVIPRISIYRQRVELATKMCDRFISLG